MEVPKSAVIFDEEGKSLGASIPNGVIREHQGDKVVVQPEILSQFNCSIGFNLAS